MKIHLINPYATLPNEGWRKYRTNIAAEQLANAGHKVTLWISNIDHRSKLKRSEKYTEFIVNENFEIRIVPSINYSQNGSISRIKYEQNFAKNVRKIFLSKNIQSDCIIITDPCVFFGDILYDIVKNTNSKFIIDILDIWPEVFITLLPKLLKPFSNFIFRPLFIKRQSLYKKADGLLAVTRDYLENALKYTKNKPAQVVYIGIEENEDILFENIKEKDDFTKEEKEKWIIYAGTLGINYDIDTLLKLALIIEKQDFQWKLLIAGDGPMKEHVSTFIENNKLTKTIYLGRLEVEKLNQLYSKCDVALSTYLKTSTVSMPVKAFDNISFGLPVINSLNREYGHLIESENIGLQYEAENAEDLFERLHYLLSSSELLFTMRKNALKLSEKFFIKEQYKAYINFVEQV